MRRAAADGNPEWRYATEGPGGGAALVPLVAPVRCYSSRSERVDDELSEAMPRSDP